MDRLMPPWPPAAARSLKEGDTPLSIFCVVILTSITRRRARSQCRCSRPRPSRRHDCRPRRNPRERPQCRHPCCNRIIRVLLTWDPSPSLSSSGYPSSEHRRYRPVVWRVLKVAIDDHVLIRLDSIIDQSFLGVDPDHPKRIDNREGLLVRHPKASQTTTGTWSIPRADSGTRNSTLARRYRDTSTRNRCNGVYMSHGCRAGPG